MSLNELSGCLMMKWNKFVDVSLSIIDNKRKCDEQSIIDYLKIHFIGFFFLILAKQGSESIGHI
jgi:hypothetical protein